MCHLHNAKYHNFVNNKCILSGIASAVASYVVPGSIPGQDTLICVDASCTNDAHGVQSRVRVTVSQIDLPYLTKLSVAGYGRMQLGVTHWATSAALLQI